MATTQMTTPAPVERTPADWTVEQAKTLYNIEGWGVGFFDVNEEGHVICVLIRSTPSSRSISWTSRGLGRAGDRAPRAAAILRILRPARALGERFANAMKEFEFTGSYTTVYPIKVNQQRHVVDEIIRFGAKHGVGLECGSKPELQAVLGLSESNEQLIVCNGYKDEEFMRLALMGQKLGHKVFIVLGSFPELDVLLRPPTTCRSSRTPRAHQGCERRIGRWADLVARNPNRDACGRLDALGEPARVVRPTRHAQADPLPSGESDHNIRVIKRALAEVARFYTELRSMGVDITHVDVGGGLGVDYDGTNSTSHASVNYTLQEYANDVIYTLAETCRTQNLPMPHVISESGRALTAHHAMLLLKVIDVESLSDLSLPVLEKQDHPLLHEMLDDHNTLGKKKLPSASSSDLPRRIVRQGTRPRPLQQRRPLAESARHSRDIYFATMKAPGAADQTRIVRRTRSTSKDLDSDLVDRYFWQLSLFQSLPITGRRSAVPIMPIHRLDERRCDAARCRRKLRFRTQKIDKFIGDEDGARARATRLSRRDDYVLGIS